MSDDLYVGGLFHTASAPNLARSLKRRKQQKVGVLVFGKNGPKSRAAYFRKRRAAQPKVRKQRACPQLDTFAELLSQGYEVKAAGEAMGVSFARARKYLCRIRKRLGPQAV